MPWILVYLLAMGLWRAVKHWRVKPRQRSLCAGCAFVHMQYGATGRNAVFCTFGAGLRPVKLDVLYCTDYRNRDASPRLVQIGFAPEIRSIEAET